MTERYLANENFPAAAVSFLREQGHDVLHAADALIGAPDDLVLRRALEEDRIVLTFDRDFGQLIFHQRRPPAPGVVLFRLRQQPPDVVLPFVRSFLASQPTLRGFFTVATPGRFRQTRLSQAPQSGP